MASFYEGVKTGKESAIIVSKFNVILTKIMTSYIINENLSK